jgi:hypothetical protein
MVELLEPVELVPELAVLLVELLVVHLSGSGSRRSSGFQLTLTSVALLSCISMSLTD